jgi:phage-related baseplate assembly protein
MAQPFSEETQELLDQAQAAIDRSAQLPTEHKVCMESARRTSFEIKLRMYRLRMARVGKFKTATY